MPLSRRADRTAALVILTAGAVALGGHAALADDASSGSSDVSVTVPGAGTPTPTPTTPAPAGTATAVPTHPALSG